MAVVYNEMKRIFSLHTRNSTYQIKADRYGYLLHLYYGKKISADIIFSLTTTGDFREILMMRGRIEPILWMYYHRNSRCLAPGIFETAR